MLAPITLRLALRVFPDDPDGKPRDLVRSVKVPAVPRVGDIVHLVPLGTSSSDVVSCEWTFEGTPVARLADIVFPEYDQAIRYFMRNEWIDSPFSRPSPSEGIHRG